jgi:hypothetical protein
MKKISLLLSFLFFSVGLGLSAASAQDQAAAVSEENLLTAETQKTTTVAAPIVKETEPTVSEKPTTVATPKATQNITKAQRFLESKVGQWVIKRMLVKAEKKSLRKELRQHKGDEATQKTLREKSKQNLNRIKTDNAVSKLSGNLRIAAILGIIGLILTFLPNPLNWIGIVLIVIALVLVLLEVI